MIRKRMKTLCVISSLLVLIGCSTLTPSGETRENSLEDFTKAMRWNHFQAASMIMKPEHRKDFLKTFEAVKQIHIIDVRVVAPQLENEGRRFSTTIEMDYYLLPSVTVKTFSFDQTWVYFDAEEQPLQGFFIVTPFPTFP